MYIITEENQGQVHGIALLFLARLFIYFNEYCKIVISFISLRGISYQ